MGGFTVLMGDEASFIHNVIAGSKYWPPVGHPIGVPYTGSHKRVVYGSIAQHVFYRQICPTV